MVSSGEPLFWGSPDPDAVARPAGACEPHERASADCGAKQGGWLMQPHEGHDREPDPGERERQRQRSLTIRLVLVIAVLLGLITPMLLWRFFV